MRCDPCCSAGAEGIEVLSHIRKRREECVGASNIATGESNYVLGLLCQYIGQVCIAPSRRGGALSF